MLNLILQLVYQRMYMGLSEERMVHLEVVTKLTMGDFTHSQLTDNLPEKPGISELTGSNTFDVLKLLMAGLSVFFLSLQWRNF